MSQKVNCGEQHIFWASQFHSFLQKGSKYGRVRFEYIPTFQSQELNENWKKLTVMLLNITNSLSENVCVCTKRANLNYFLF